LVWKQYATPLSDGLIHIAVNYSGGSTAPTATIKNLAQGAVADWNLYKCITGVVFEESTSSADLYFEYTTDESLTGSCAAYRPLDHTIYHGPEFQTRVAGLSAVQSKAAFAHELGHFLGLGHTTSPATIMNQPDGMYGFHVGTIHYAI